MDVSSSGGFDEQDRRMRNSPPLYVERTLTGAQFSCGHCRATDTRSMKNFTLITALSLCSFSWISVSLSESQTVEVKPGQDVTLQTDKLVNYETVTFWFRLVDRTNPRCISVWDYGSATYCKGIQQTKFEMSSNTSTVSLKIKQVDLSDSGLYFCGFYTSGGPTFSVINLKVEGSDEPHDDVDNKCTKDSDGITKLMSVILGGLTFLLVNVIIGLVVTVGKLQSSTSGERLISAASEEQKPRQRENLDSDDLKDADLSLYPTTIRSRRPESERQVETRVLYAASR